MIETLTNAYLIVSTLALLFAYVCWSKVGASNKIVSFLMLVIGAAGIIVTLKTYAII